MDDAPGGKWKGMSGEEPKLRQKGGLMIGAYFIFGIDKEGTVHWIHGGQHYDPVYVREANGHYKRDKNDNYDAKIWGSFSLIDQVRSTSSVASTAIFTAFSSGLWRC